MLGVRASWEGRVTHLAVAEPPEVVTAVNLPPLVKWAGGKRWLVPELRKLYAPHRERRLVEPFCGGLSVVLGLMPQRALLNDLCVPVVALYREVQGGLDWPATWPHVNTRAGYYAARAEFNACCLGGARQGLPYRSLLFYWLLRHCFNGLCRFNRSGGFNTPFGGYKNPKVVRDFSPHQRAFEPWDFLSGDFESALAARIDTDFIYADPPYDGVFAGYTGSGFSWDDQVRLADALHQHAGPVVVSNVATDRVLALYRDRGFNVRTLLAPRRISCDGDRTPAMEMLATRGL